MRRRRRSGHRSLPCRTSSSALAIGRRKPLGLGFERGIWAEEEMEAGGFYGGFANVITLVFIEQN